MRVLHRDLRAGEIKLRFENPDDLWHLHNLVLPGDLVRASTYRREESKADKIRPERMEKVRVTLTIRIDKVEFQAFSDRLRLTGVITEGEMDHGQHHTLNVAVDDVLTIIKAWRPHELRRIEDAVAATQKPIVAFLSLDDEEALRSGVGSKVFEESRVAVETRLVERVLEGIARGAPVAYGPAEVAQAVEAGAVETLLVSDAVVRDAGVEGIMRDAESSRGAVVLVSRHHEAGARLESLGGIAALLRFPIK